MKQKFIKSMLILTLLFGVACYLILNFPYSSGTRSGRLIKISKKGYLIKTFEGQLDLGSGDNSQWHFSVRSSKLGEELERKIGQRLILNYHELLFPIFYETKYDIKGYEVEMVITPEARALLCRLIDTIRDHKGLVDQLRTVLEAQDKEMLLVIRKECQGPSEK